MKDYKKDFNDKLEDDSFCDGVLISIANGYITEMQNIITELEKDKQYFSDSLDKQIEATLKLHKDYQELEQKNHDIVKNSLDISNQFDELEEKLANADYQLEGRDVTIKELRKENAELKEQKMYWKESSFDWRHKFFKLDKVKRLIKKDKQLTKAKNIIREFVEWANWQGNSKCPSFKSIQDKAEQFLKDCEVEK